MRSVGSKRVAYLGVLGILFQAILFGWHHHDLVLSSRGASSAVQVAAGPPSSPADAEDHCDICQTLHHLTGLSGAIDAAALPVGSVSVPRSSLAALQFRAAARAFRARAPPRA